MDWPKGALRPIHDIRDHYPRYFEDPGSDFNIHGPDYAPAKVDLTIHNWTYIEPIGYIDQVPHTYAYTLGTYAIQNEKQVSIGESTCRCEQWHGKGLRLMTFFLHLLRHGRVNVS